MFPKAYLFIFLIDNRLEQVEQPFFLTDFDFHNIEVLLNPRSDAGIWLFCFL